MNYNSLTTRDHYKSANTICYLTTTSLNTNCYPITSPHYNLLSPLQVVIYSKSALQKCDLTTSWSIQAVTSLQTAQYKLLSDHKPLTTNCQTTSHWSLTSWAASLYKPALNSLTTDLYSLNLDYILLSHFAHLYYHYWSVISLFLLHLLVLLLQFNLTTFCYVTSTFCNATTFRLAFMLLSF